MVLGNIPDRTVQIPAAAGKLFAEGLPGAAYPGAFQASYDHHSAGIDQDVRHDPQLVRVHAESLGTARRAAHWPPGVLARTSIHVP